MTLMGSRPAGSLALRRRTPRAAKAACAVQAGTVMAVDAVLELARGIGDDLEQLRDVGQVGVPPSRVTGTGRRRARRWAGPSRRRGRSSGPRRARAADLSLSPDAAGRGLPPSQQGQQATDRSGSPRKRPSASGSYAGTADDPRRRPSCRTEVARRGCPGRSALAHSHRLAGRRRRRSGARRGPGGAGRGAGARARSGAGPCPGRRRSVAVVGPAAAKRSAYESMAAFPLSRGSWRRGRRPSACGAPRSRAGCGRRTRRRGP